MGKLPAATPHSGPLGELWLGVGNNAPAGGRGRQPGAGCGAQWGWRGQRRRLGSNPALGWDPAGVGRAVWPGGIPALLAMEAPLGRVGGGDASGEGEGRVGKLWGEPAEPGGRARL